MNSDIINRPLYSDTKDIKYLLYKGWPIIENFIMQAYKQLALNRQLLNFSTIGSVISIQIAICTQTIS